METLCEIGWGCLGLIVGVENCPVGMSGYRYKFRNKWNHHVELNLCFGKYK